MTDATGTKNAAPAEPDAIKLDHSDYLEFENAWLKIRIAADALRTAEAFGEHVRRRLIDKYSVVGQWRVDPATETLRREASRNTEVDARLVAPGQQSGERLAQGD